MLLHKCKSKKSVFVLIAQQKALNKHYNVVIEVKNENKRQKNEKK